MITITIYLRKFADYNYTIIAIINFLNLIVFFTRIVLRFIKKFLIFLVVVITIVKYLCKFTDHKIDLKKVIKNG